VNVLSTLTAGHTEERSPPKPRRWLLPAVAVTTLAALLGVFHAPVLRLVYSYLVVDQPVAAVDFAVIGDGDSKIWVAAAQLYRSGMVQGVLVVNNINRPTIRAGIQPSLLEAVRPVLIRHGVAAVDIHEVPIDANTLVENIHSIDHWVQDHGRSAIYLAPAHRSRYCRNAIDLVLGNGGQQYTVDAVSTGRYDGRTWWRTRSGVTAVFSSYLCLLSVWNGDMNRAESKEWDPDEYVESLLNPADSQ
jgi:hypothetical protein